MSCWTYRSKHLLLQYQSFMFNFVRANYGIKVVACLLEAEDSKSQRFATHPQSSWFIAIYRQEKLFLSLLDFVHNIPSRLLLLPSPRIHKFLPTAAGVTWRPFLDIDQNFFAFSTIKGQATTRLARDNLPKHQHEPRATNASIKSIWASTLSYNHKNVDSSTRQWYQATYLLTSAAKARRHLSQNFISFPDSHRRYEQWYGFSPRASNSPPLPWHDRCSISLFGKRRANVATQPSLHKPRNTLWDYQNRQTWQSIFPQQARFNIRYPWSNG